MPNKVTVALLGMVEACEMFDRIREKLSLKDRSHLAMLRGKAFAALKEVTGKTIEELMVLQYKGE